MRQQLGVVQELARLVEAALQFGMNIRQVDKKQNKTKKKNKNKKQESKTKKQNNNKQQTSKQNTKQKTFVDFLQHCAHAIRGLLNFVPLLRALLAHELPHGLMSVCVCVCVCLFVLVHNKQANMCHSLQHRQHFSTKCFCFGLLR